MRNFTPEVFINRKRFIIAINYLLNGELLQTFYFDEGMKIISIIPRSEIPFKFKLELITKKVLKSDFVYIKVF